MKLLRGLIFSNLWISLAAVALTYIQSVLFEYKLSTNLLALLFLGTFSSYNYIYIVSSFTQSNRMNLNHLIWLKKHRTVIVISSSLSLLLCVYLFLGLNTIQKTLLLIAGLLSLFYVLPNNSKIGLRWIPYLKTPIILITWLVATSILPQIKSQLSQFKATTILFAIPFLLGWILLFDLRDYSKDVSSIKTWPQKLGFRNTKFIALSLLTVAFIILIPEINNSAYQLASLVVLCLYGLFIFCLNRIPSGNYNIIFDGLPIAWAGSLWFVQLLQ